MVEQRTENPCVPGSNPGLAIFLLFIIYYLMERLQISNILKFYQLGIPLTCLSLYDATMATIADSLDIPLLLVGDSLGMTILGYEDTVNVSLDDCIRHAAAVVRGSKKAFVVGDLPFLTYHGSIDKTLEVVRQLVQKAGVHSVKLEGGFEVVDTIKAIIQAGIPVMGHLGILPQRVRITEGYKVKGRQKKDAQLLVDEAIILQEAGVFAIVLEGVTSKVAELITSHLNIPTIGIGAGLGCSGQIQVVNDILGLSKNLPKHAKSYVNLAEQVKKAFYCYKQEVEGKSFPTKKESFS